MSEDVSYPVCADCGVLIAPPLGWAIRLRPEEGGAIVCENCVPDGIPADVPHGEGGWLPWWVQPALLATATLAAVIVIGVVGRAVFG